MLRRKRKAGEEIIDKRQRCEEEEQREREKPWWEGGIGSDANKSIQQGRKVEMRKGGEKLDEKKSSFEYRWREAPSQLQEAQTESALLRQGS